MGNGRLGIMTTLTFQSFTGAHRQPILMAIADPASLSVQNADRKGDICRHSYFYRAIRLYRHIPENFPHKLPTTAAKRAVIKVPYVVIRHGNRLFQAEEPGRALRNWCNGGICRCRDTVWRHIDTVYIVHTANV